jgi:DNA-binding NtrC family response regulator
MEKPLLLILEDLSNWQDTLRRLADENVYQIFVVDSLEKAVALLKHNGFDVAIVDVRLDEGNVNNIDGISFLSELEKYYDDFCTHVIMLSGHATIAHTTNALTRPNQMVTNFFLKQEIDNNQLIDALAHAVRITQAERLGRSPRNKSTKVGDDQK